MGLTDAYGYFGALSNKDICDKITKGISMKKTIITFLVGLLIQTIRRLRKARLISPA